MAILVNNQNRPSHSNGDQSLLTTPVNDLAAICCSFAVEKKQHMEATLIYCIAHALKTSGEIEVL